MTHTPETLKAWQAGLSLSESGMATYVGVPLHTWRKWLNGTRKPDAAPCALLDLLAVLPVECPALHALRLENAHKVAKPVKATQISTKAKKTRQWACGAAGWGQNGTDDPGKHRKHGTSCQHAQRLPLVRSVGRCP